MCLCIADRDTGIPHNAASLQAGQDLGSMAAAVR